MHMLTPPTIEIVGFPGGGGKDLEDFRDKWRHYNEQAAAESQVILDKISELFEKDGDSK